MNGSDITPVSLEVLEYGIKQHECVQGWEVVPGCGAVCACISTALFLCEECGAPLYFAIRPDRPVCRHAREASGSDPWSREWSYVSIEALVSLLTGGTEGCNND